MTDHFSLSSEEVKDISLHSLKKFVKHVFVVTKKLEDRRKAREALTKHLQTIKRESKSKKFKKDTLNKHLVVLESKVQELLDKEAKLLRSQEYENKTIQELRKKIEDLEEQLLQNESEKDNLRQINMERIQSMQISMNALRQKIEQYIDQKGSRDKRIMQLENKIKLKVGYERPNDKEREIEKLQKKYMILQRKGASQTVLDKVRERISFLMESSS